MNKFDGCGRVYLYRMGEVYSNCDSDLIYSLIFVIFSEMAMKQVSGQVVHIRQLSKKIVFFDIETKVELENAEVSETADQVVTRRVTVVLKSSQCEEGLVKKATRSHEKLHVGDEVCFSGFFEEPQTFSASKYEVECYWSVANSGTPFTPKPPEDLKKPLKMAENIDSDKSEGECKFFLNTGRCPKVSCRFSHSEDLVSRANHVREKKQRRQRVHETLFEGEGEMVSNSQRAAVFADWIVTKFGEDRLREGLILDVAGGSGDLAFELATRRGLACAVVDPRPPKLKKWQVKYRKKHPGAKEPRHYQAYFDCSFLTTHSILPSSVCLVVGLHPDQATEPLVSTALHLGLSFCVIPCCVFSSAFPERRMKDGSSPSSYEQFCDYLKEKDGRMGEERLPFMGKNKVLFLDQQNEDIREHMVAETNKL